MSKSSLKTKKRTANDDVKDKAARLIRVYLAMISTSVLIVWMQKFLVDPLNEDEKEMAHMDPSEIIKVPIPLKRVYSFTMLPVVSIMFLWLKNTPHKLTSNILSLVKLTLAIYGLFGLCGSNIVENYQHSLSSALFLAALLSTTWTGKETSNILEQLPVLDASDLLSFCRFYGMILTLVPFQTLNILDSGIQIQRWPLTLLLGATYGYGIGTIVGIISKYFQRKNTEKSR